MKQVRQINCSNIECETYEELPIDYARHQANLFDLVTILPSSEATYRCKTCGDLCCSEIGESEVEE